MVLKLVAGFFFDEKLNFKVFVLSNLMPAKIYGCVSRCFNQIAEFVRSHQLHGNAHEYLHKAYSM